RILTTRPGTSTVSASGTADAIAAFSASVASAPMSFRSICVLHYGRDPPASASSQLLDPDRRGLELRRAGFGVPGLDRQLVDVHLLRIVDGHERQAGTHLGVDAHRG